VAETAIDVIPDEQEAIAAALAMGRPGDLLLVFADALTRSWKQIIKFKPDASGESASPAQPPPAFAASRPTTRPTLPTGEAASWGSGSGDASLEAQGFVREERGLRFVGEAAD